MNLAQRRITVLSFVVPGLHALLRTQCERNPHGGFTITLLWVLVENAQQERPVLLLREGGCRMIRLPVLQFIAPFLRSR